MRNDTGRAAGVLLHPTSFPGRHGIGDFGRHAYRFVDFLAEAGQSVWQVLPLGPTGYGDSPYASFSSFAGNPLLISVTDLVETEDAPGSCLEAPPEFPSKNVDFAAVVPWKLATLERAARHFLAIAAPARITALAEFSAANASWLDDYALFMAAKAAFSGPGDTSWHACWDENLAKRRPQALRRWTARLADDIAIRQVWQFWFFEQWNRLRTYANSRGIRLIGDLPIFVASDSVDVWANPHLFKLDERGKPLVVAGVPPDYFSATGQLWGNPLYDWERMKKERFRWWVERVRASLNTVDVVRIDHFRGFQASWEVPSGSADAIRGRWVEAPGDELFAALKREMGDLPVIAEDLGVITPEVVALRERFGFPGMKILQFGFDLGEAGSQGASNPFLPHNYPRDCVVYTGTHDNDTVVGWYAERSKEERQLVRTYTGAGPRDVAWAFIRLAWASVARIAVAPLQDLLALDSSARMNIPSEPSGNWMWRYEEGDLSPRLARRLRHLTEASGRAAAISDLP